MLACGDTFLSGDDEYEDYHLNVVLTPPNEGELITVSITTLRRLSERLVTLQPGDHPFITRPSAVAYSFARIRRVVDIEAALEADNAKAREPATGALLAKIQAGLLESEHTPHGIKQLYRFIMGL
jgi:hypothetical protein